MKSLALLRHPITVTAALLVLGYFLARVVVTVYVMTHETPTDLFTYAEQQGAILTLIVVFILLWLVAVAAFTIWRHRRSSTARRASVGRPGTTASPH